MKPLGDALLRPFPLPASFRALLAGYDRTQVAIGKSRAKTFRLQLSHRPPLYLKIARKWPRRDLLEERNVLRWLVGKLAVPDILLFDEDQTSEYLLLTEVPGTDAASLTGGITRADLVRVLARGLRAIHAVSPQGCPFDRSLEREIELAAFNVSHNLVDAQDFDASRIGRSVKDLYLQLLASRPATKDHVFTHGDYCLPNVILQGGRVTGFVDWSRAGVGDPYRDLALAARSIRKNLGPGLETAFFSEYGIHRPDAARIEYYTLLDEFF